MTVVRSILAAEGFTKVMNTLADAVQVRYGSCAELALVGIQRRGVDIASALAALLLERTGTHIPLGSLDIAFYRDDWTVHGPKPAVGSTHIPFDVDGKTLLLVDDVLYTGRTIRAALEALGDFGRPSRIELLVLVDRGHRELPIQPDYVGLTVSTAPEDRVDVLVESLDGENSVRLIIPEKR